jgi:hypothetical protein
MQPTEVDLRKCVTLLETAINDRQNGLPPEAMTDAKELRGLARQRIEYLAAIRVAQAEADARKAQEEKIIKQKRDIEIARKRLRGMLNDDISAMERTFGSDWQSMMSGGNTSGASDTYGGSAHYESGSSGETSSPIGYRDAYGGMSGYIDGENLRDTYGNWVGSIRNNKLYDNHGNFIGEFRGSSLYDSSGNFQGEMRGKHFYDNFGNYKYTVE